MTLPSLSFQTEIFQTEVTKVLEGQALSEMIMRLGKRWFHKEMMEDFELFVFLAVSSACIWMPFTLNALKALNPVPPPPNCFSQPKGSPVCHGKLKLPSELGFPTSTARWQRLSVATFLRVLPLRPSKRLGDNDHVVNRSAALEAAQIWEKGRALWNELIKL